MPGEQQVLESFSKEWLEYSYDGVLWTSTYEDQEAALRHEIRASIVQNIADAPSRRVSFLEVGCGLGIITQLAHNNWRFDAVGVDLSYAAFRAAEHYRANPFLHFVQASAFYLPFATRSFDVVYSRGVLHHTYSTRKALQNVAEYCRPGGGFFVWLYGPGSTGANLFRRGAYLLETAVRPILSRRSSSPFATALLKVLSIAYVGVNRFQRWRNPEVEPYTFNRALHAARDRFTPRFAHRQSAEEVAGWFRETGFDQVSSVDWRLIPASLQENYRRNVGLWARKSLARG
jgi:SAM-dependent methyltransferase